jgi:serine phosphatase RsbU (regulator of sigma subunit)/anti-sigma regulatory factor (Ser/Thr protein kinase)
MTLRRYSPVAVLLAVLALVVVAAVLAWRQYDDARSAATGELRSRTTLATADFDQLFSGDINVLNAVARSDAVRAGNRTAMLRYFLRVTAKERASLGGISWIDARGVSRVTSSKTTLAKPVDVSDRDYFIQVKRSDASYVSAGLVSRRNGQHVVALAVPTHAADGTFNGVLVGSIAVETNVAVQRILQQFGDLTVLDRDGQSITEGFRHPPNMTLVRRIQAASNGTHTLTDSTGLDGANGRVVVWDYSSSAAWSLVIDRSRSGVYATARRALILDLSLVGGLAALLIALIAWLGSRVRREARRQSAHLAREHDIALRLQRSMLPASLPDVDGVDLACRYRAGVAGVEVGGDWYDVLARDDGFVHMIVGDVAGRGIDAATLMGQLRSAFHAYAFDHGSPAEVLRRMIRLVPSGSMATAVCMTLDPFTGDLRYATAGHPPPLAIDAATRTVRLLDVGGAPPLGYVAPDMLVDARVVLPAGTTVIAYTDGLVERRTASIDVGIARLSDALVAGAELDADALAGAVLEQVGDASPAEEDDIALLVLELLEVPACFRAEIPADPAELAPLRRRLRRWLALRHVPESHREDAVLAITEACSNSIEHGYESADGTIAVVVAHDGGQLEIVIRDRGHWRARGGDDEDSDRGRGLSIMRSIMRDTAVVHDDHGTVVTMLQSVGA